MIISADYREHSINELTNDSSAAILQMVPVVYRKFLTMKPRNQTNVNNKNTSTIEGHYSTHTPNVVEMLRNIARYNELQSVLNEDLFGPLQNDSVIIVVQVNIYKCMKKNSFAFKIFRVDKKMPKIVYKHRRLQSKTQLTQF